MNRVTIVLFAIAVFVSTCAAGIAQPSQPHQVRVTEKSTKKLALQANNPSAYRTVAECYRKLHDDYQAKATAEMGEWTRRAEHPWMKNPSADSAHGLYEYYRDKAAKMSELSSKYRIMADSTPDTTGK